MIVLANTTDKIQIVLGQAVATSQLQCFASYRDSNATDFVPGRNIVATNNTTNVDLVDSPGVGYVRGIDFISVYNKDTASAFVTVKALLDSVSYTLWSGYLNRMEKLEYHDSIGFVVKSMVGAIKTENAEKEISPAAYVPAITQSNVVVLNRDVELYAATSLQDIIGLEFPVNPATLYWFEFTIRYQTSASTVGTLFTLRGPPIRYLMYDTSYSLAATTVTTNANLIAFEGGATNTDTANTPNARAIIRGLFVSTADGYITAAMDSETDLASSVIAKAGSFVRWTAMYQY